MNLETKEKQYSADDSKHMCTKDGWVCFRNSELLCGRLGKATLGGGNKSGLFQVSRQCNTVVLYPILVTLNHYHVPNQMFHICPVMLKVFGLML